MDEALSEVSIPAHFLLSGLWTLADREGRLEDRPRFIKANVFPYRDIAVEPLLAELAAVGRIARYHVDGVDYIEVANWSRDQRPHVRETPSTYPGSAQAQPRQCSGTTKASGLPGEIQAASPPRLLGSGNGILDLGSEIQGRTASASAGPAAEQPPKPKAPTADRGALGEFIDWARAEVKLRLPADAVDIAAGMSSVERVKLGEAVKLQGLATMQVAFRLWVGWQAAQDKGYTLGFFAHTYGNSVAQAKAKPADPSAPAKPKMRVM